MEEVLKNEEEMVQEEINNNEPIEEVKEEVSLDSEEEVEEEPKKKLSRRERKNQKLYKLFTKPDIKYRGPLAYYHLRIVAWISIAVTAVVGVLSFEQTIGVNLISEKWLNVLSSISALSLPMFLIATFATILNKNKTYKSVIIFYTAAYLGMAVVFLILYYRYVNGIIKLISPEMNVLITSVIKSVGFKLNIFADLLVLSLFNLFINYTPKNHFQGKKLYLFRSFAIIPLLFALASYIIEVLIGFDVLKLHIALYPFLTTKSPLIYVLFIVLSLWIKKRERQFIRIGFTREQYDAFLKTNRNSLAFSVKLSIILVILALVDLILVVTALVVQEVAQIPEAMNMAGILKIGDCAGTLIAIPFILLFSYTRRTKNQMMDLMVAFGGIILVVLVYIESIYQLIVQLLSNVS